MGQENAMLLAEQLEWYYLQFLETSDPRPTVRKLEVSEENIISLGVDLASLCIEFLDTLEPECVTQQPGVLVLEMNSIRIRDFYPGDFWDVLDDFFSKREPKPNFIEARAATWVMKGMLTARFWF